jgi:ferredoxin-like protein FixX
MQNMTPRMTTCPIDERFVRPWADFKGNIYQKRVCAANCPTPQLQKFINLKRLLHQKKCLACSVIDTACTIFASENRSYLGEFGAEFKKALARESGAQGVLFDEKTKVKIS